MKKDRQARPPNHPCDKRVLAQAGKGFDIQCNPQGEFGARTGPLARRLQDIESDTGYDTRRRAPGGVLSRVSQTAVYDTG